MSSLSGRGQKMATTRLAWMVPEDQDEARRRREPPPQWTGGTTGSRAPPRGRWPAAWDRSRDRPRHGQLGVSDRRCRRGRVPQCVPGQPGSVALRLRLPPTQPSRNPRRSTAQTSRLAASRTGRPSRRRDGRQQARRAAPVSGRPTSRGIRDAAPPARPRSRVRSDVTATGWSNGSGQDRLWYRVRRYAGASVVAKCLWKLRLYRMEALVPLREAAPSRLVRVGSVTRRGSDRIAVDGFARLSTAPLFARLSPAP